MTELDNEKRDPKCLTMKQKKKKQKSNKGTQFSQCFHEEVIQQSMVKEAADTCLITE